MKYDKNQQQKDPGLFRTDSSQAQYITFSFYLPFFYILEHLGEWEKVWKGWIRMGGGVKWSDHWQHFFSLSFCN